MAGPTAFEVLECITEEMDLISKVTEHSWRVRIHPFTYQLLKDFDATGRPDWWRNVLFYQRDGVEYIRAWHNEVIPFILHYRVVVDGTLDLGVKYGTAVERDDDRHDVQR